MEEFIQELKSNMVTLECSCHKIGRHEHSNPEEAEVNFKCKFMRIVEIFKEEILKSLKEMKDRTNKKIGRNQ